MAATIHVMAYDEAGLDEARVESMQQARRMVGTRRVTWINVDLEDDPEVLASLEQDFGIHPLTAEDVKHTHQRPKIEEYAEYLYVVAQMLRRDAEGELSTEQVSLLLGDGWVVTVQEKPGDVFDGVRERIRSGRPRICTAGPDYLLYAIIDAIVDAYFPILEDIGMRTEELEDRILADTKFEEHDELQAIRRELLTLRRVAWPQRDALGALERGENRWITHESARSCATSATMPPACSTSWRPTANSPRA